MTYPNENPRAVQLVLQRRKECGIGLAGSHEAIARWLFREHGIITSTTWIADVVSRRTAA